MSWFSQVFSNPVKTLTDVGTLGGTFALRETKIAPKLANNITRVYAATTAGVVSGLATGGIPGAFAGGAAGFGRGIAAAVHGEDITLNTLGAGAKYGAIAGGATGLFTGLGAAGFIRNQLITGATKIPAVPKLGAAIKDIGGTAGILGLINKLGAATSGISAPPANNPIPYPGVDPGLHVQAPDIGSTVGAPGVDIIREPGAGTSPWLFVLLAALVGALVFLRKKRHGR